MGDRSDFVGLPKDIESNPWTVASPLQNKPALQKAGQPTQDANYQDQPSAAPPETHKSYIETAVDVALKPVLKDKETRDVWDHRANEFAKTAALFAGGRFGIGATLLVYGLAQASPETGATRQAEDFTLGAAKGGVLKIGYEVAAQNMKFAPTKGIAMGILSRSTDVVFDRNSWANPSAAAAKLGSEVINPKAWMMDAALWTVSEGAFGVGNMASKGALAQNKVMGGMVMGGTFGATSGMAGEIQRQHDAHEDFNFGKVLKEGLIDGGLGSLAAGTGIKVSQSYYNWRAPSTGGGGTAAGGDQTAAQNKAIVDNKGTAAPAEKSNIHINLTPQGRKITLDLRTATATEAVERLQSLKLQLGSAKPDALVRVESTNVPELPTVNNPPPKEFKIVSGKSELNDFRHYNSDSAMLSVKEVVGKKFWFFNKYGAEKSLFVQRLGGNEGTLLPQADKADLVVSCHPENLSEVDRARHVFGDAHGKVWMVTGAMDNRLLLSAGERPIATWRINGYTHPVRLDGGYTTINVMAPLLVGDPNNHQSADSQTQWRDFDRMLKEVKALGVDAVSTDVWWGLIEPNRRQYNWSYYDELSNHVVSAGLKWVPILSFHQCGGNIGDNVNVPLPDHAWEDLAAKFGGDVNAARYKSEYGNVSKEVISAWADDQAMENYQRVMKAFADHFADKAKNIGEINVSMGPAGELRFPSYNAHDGAIAGYPTRGALQAYSQLAIDSFRDYAMTKYGGLGGLKKAWNIPNLAEDQILPPSDPNGFFNRNDHLNLQYGKDFFDWYNQSLIDHGDRMMRSALDVFGTKGSAYYGIDLGGKIPGIHWRVGEWQNGNLVPGDRLAELAAGLIRTSDSANWFNEQNGFGYRPILTMFRQLQPERPGTGTQVVPSFTATEMPDGQDGPSARSMAHTLAVRVGQEAERQDLWLKGENALGGDLGSSNDWDLMRSLLDLPQQQGYYHGLTLLRMSDIVDNPTARAKILELVHMIRSVGKKNAA
ncbi:MAG TPA: family 14 glycosylhydrolase [Trichormus sp.]|jgi:hypothetical protein